MTRYKRSFRRVHRELYIKEEEYASYKGAYSRLVEGELVPIVTRDCSLSGGHSYSLKEGIYILGPHYYYLLNGKWTKCDDQYCFYIITKVEEDCMFVDIEFYSTNNMIEYFDKLARLI